MAAAKSKDPFAAMGRGFAAPFAAARLLWRSRKIKRYALLPFAVNAILYLLAWMLFVYLMRNWDWGDYAFDFMGAWGDWLFNVAKWILFVPVSLVVCYFTFTAVGMVLASPANDILSERVERTLCGEREAEALPLKLTLYATFVSILDSAWIVAQQGMLSLLVLPLLLVPALGFVPLFLVTAYFAGLGFLDTAMARNLLGPRLKRPAVREMRYEILGLGIAMDLLFLIPFLGLFLLPLGVTAGTSLYCDFDWERLLEQKQLPSPPGFVPPRKRDATPEDTA